jgi:Tol biopolymer transport system component
MRWLAGAVLLLAVSCSAGENGSPEVSAAPATSSPVETPTRTAGLYVLELATGALEPLAGVPPDSSALGAAVSADGTRIAFDAAVDGSRQVWVMDADGTDLERVTDEIEAIEPTWSPNERSVAYTGITTDGLRAIFVVDLGSGEARRVTSERSDVFGADWSPDGDSIVYQVEHGEGWRLRSVDVRSGKALTLCCDRPESLASDADWSPDGELLVFGYATPEDNFALRTITPTGRHETPVPPLDPTRYHGHPVWSPDRSQIAYQGAPGIWVLDLEAQADRMLDPEMWGPVWLDHDTLIVEMPPEG